MKVIGDICYPLRKYTGQDGSEKTAWGKCGTLMQNADGNYRIKLEMLPVAMPAGEGWFAVFEKKDAPEQQARPAPQRPATQQDFDPDADLPF